MNSTNNNLWVVRLLLCVQIGTLIVQIGALIQTCRQDLKSFTFPFKFPFFFLLCIINTHARPYLNFIMLPSVLLGIFYSVFPIHYQYLGSSYFRVLPQILIKIFIIITILLSCKLPYMTKMCQMAQMICSSLWRLMHFSIILLQTN